MPPVYVEAKQRRLAWQMQHNDEGIVFHYDSRRSRLMPWFWYVQLQSINAILGDHVTFLHLGLSLIIAVFRLLNSRPIGSLINSKIRVAFVQLPQERCIPNPRWCWLLRVITVVVTLPIASQIRVGTLVSWILSLINYNV